MCQHRVSSRQPSTLPFRCRLCYNFPETTTVPARGGWARCRGLGEAQSARRPGSNGVGVFAFIDLFVFNEEYGNLTCSNFGNDNPVSVKSYFWPYPSWSSVPFDRCHPPVVEFDHSAGFVSRCLRRGGTSNIKPHIAASLATVPLSS